MKNPRIYVEAPLAVDSTIEVEAGAANHLRVLRLRPGDILTAFDGRGGEYAAELVELDKRRATIRTSQLKSIERESPLQICLVQGISKGDRMDYTIQKAVELGVERIVPVFTRRSVVQLEGNRLQKRMDHWRGVIIGACEQCGRNRIPELGPAQPLNHSWASLPQGARLVLDPDGDVSLRQLAGDSRALTLLIGPEGGLTEAELERAVDHGFRRLRLGPRVLRTETAGVAVLAGLQALAGDLS